MAPVHRILVPYDGSNISRWALARAKRILGLPGKSVTILRVEEMPLACCKAEVPLDGVASTPRPIQQVDPRVSSSPDSPHKDDLVTEQTSHGTLDLCRILGAFTHG